MQMGIHKRVKKAMTTLLSGVLTFGMVAGVIPAVPEDRLQVQAATGKEPSMTAYATKEQLMNETYKDSSSGEYRHDCMLIFGRNNEGKDQKWYIIGKDDGISGDNIALFAADSIATNVIFNPVYDFSKNPKSYQKEYGTYTDGLEDPSNVPSSHYGASELRAKLQEIASDEDYFSVAEQCIMQETKTFNYDNECNDIDNKWRTYTTTDKLYALHGDWGMEVLYAGSIAGSGIRLGMTYYWNNSDSFWLRESSHPNTTQVLVANPGVKGNDCVDYIKIDNKSAIRPATNLNLTNVLFSSSAQAATTNKNVYETIAKDTAMTLRLNGENKDIGTVTCNAEKGQIIAQRGSTSGNVSLIVQGNDGTNDWYYSKQISGTDKVIINDADLIMDEGAPSNIDFTNCKIWLETTEDRVTYAVEATPTDDVVMTDILTVNITDIEKPVSNVELDTSAECAIKGVKSTAPVVTWTPDDSTAKYNTSYTASVTITPYASYQFPENMSVKVDGEPATKITHNADGTLLVAYEFPATAKDRLKYIYQPDIMTVPNGTSYENMNLPTLVDIRTEGNTKDQADVSWDTTSPVSGSYDPSILTEQMVTLKGKVTCPSDIDTNGIEINITITIIISEAEKVGIPTAWPASGIYTENQKVMLSSSTNGAKIYYTTDGSEPVVDGGVMRGTTMEYTVPIKVIGEEGQSVVTTIKAIAVKAGMQNSNVQIFNYTIEIPEIPIIPPIVTKHIITATAGAHGNISTSGEVEVTEGDSQTYTITADEGYEIDTLKVDGSPVANTTSYTFENVTEAHTIEVTFKKIASIEPVINAPIISSQPQSVSVKVGERATFTVAADGTDITYQWKIDRNDGNGFVDISGANSASYTTSEIDKNCNGFKYQCVVSNLAGNVTTDIATLTVTDNITSSTESSTESESIQYEILDGADSSWTQNTDGSVVIRGSGDISKFQNVKVDGNVVDAQYYTVTEGSTIITLKPEYLRTLSTGSHTIEIVWTDGSASTHFTVAQNTSDGSNNNNSSNSNDSSNNNSSENNNNANNSNNNSSNNNSSEDRNSGENNNSPNNNSNDNNNKNNNSSKKNNKKKNNKKTDSAKNKDSNNKDVTVPKTGDTSDLNFWLALLLISIAGVTGLFVGRKKIDN